MRTQGRSRTIPRKLRAWLAVPAIAGLALGMSAAQASADAGDFSIDFAAAAPSSYDHSTGGGAFDDRTINVDVVESLNGGDFACGDIVTFLPRVTVDAGAANDQSIRMDLEFDASTTGGDGEVGFSDIVNVAVNRGNVGGEGPGGTDAGLSDDGGTVATLTSETLPAGFTGTLDGSVTLNDLDAGEAIVVRIDVLLSCGTGPANGVVQSRLDSAVNIVPDDGNIPGAGNQTIPLNDPGDVDNPDDPDPELEPIQISKNIRFSSVDGHWKWNVAKWTTGPLWAEIYQPKKYDYRVVVDSHGFVVTSAIVSGTINLNNPNDVSVTGTLTDMMPGFQCTVAGVPERTLPPGEQLSSFVCQTDTDPGAEVTNTATFTPDAESGLEPVQATDTEDVDRTPPPNAPGRRVVLKDKMAGSKGLKVLDAISGPRTAKVGYSAMLDVPPPTGIAWCHNIHNTAHLFDTETRERVARSNRVTVRICKPEDYYDKKGKPAGEDTPKIDPPKAPLPTAPKAKDGTPKITPAVGGPKKINPRYRTKLATRIMAPRVRYRGQLMRVRVITRNATTRRAYGVVVKAKLPTGMKLVAKPANVHLGKRNTIWWTRKAIGSKKRIARTLRVVAIRPKAYKLRAISNARNAKRSADRHRILVKRPPAPAPMPR